jgi:hypothetical protein
MPPADPTRTRHAASYDCPEYVARPRSKRCRHYLDGGACALATEFQCVEWLKANDRPLPAGHPALVTPAGQRGLFSQPVPGGKEEESLPAPAPAPAPVTVPSPLTEPPPPSRTWLREPITQEEIDSFKALGVELCIRLEELGEVWLVPEYTDQERKEITPEHAATLRLLLDAFPGARVTAFDKLTRAKERQP